MCGIFAHISKYYHEYDTLYKHGNKCNHRGPDNTIVELDNYKEFYLFLMFHRLAINGLDSISNQPMTIDNITIICNGEIYNFKELAEKNNIKLKTNSDCEVIIHLYKIYGIDCIGLLDGVFSFLLFDKSTGLVYVGHDPLGIRSLYMIYSDNNFAISSEMKCLTGFNEKIEMVAPGSYIKYNLNYNTCDEYKYFNLDFHNIYIDDITSISMIQNCLFDSIKKRLLTERPFGCLLSGGIDSSIIAGLICKLIEPKDVKTFSIGLNNSPDLKYAKIVSDHLGTNHTEIIVTEEQMLEAIEPTIKQIESFDTTTVRASVPMYLLSKYINENTDIKVIFSGEGADELSGSYLYFHNSPSPEAFQKECIKLLNDVQHFDVLRGDKTTAGNGLEIRVPFFDKEFVKNYMSIDPKLKMVRNGFEKYLLRKSFEDLLPEEIIWRRKDGFSDGVSDDTRPWYQIIEEYCINTKGMSEKDYYKYLFSKYYKNHEYIVPYEWLPKWTEQSNPSGRLIL